MLFELTVQHLNQYTEYFQHQKISSMSQIVSMFCKFVSSLNFQIFFQIQVLINFLYIDITCHTSRENKRSSLSIMCFLLKLILLKFCYITLLHKFTASLLFVFDKILYLYNIYLLQFPLSYPSSSSQFLLPPLLSRSTPFLFYVKLYLTKMQKKQYYHI